MGLSNPASMPMLAAPHLEQFAQMIAFMFTGGASIAVFIDVGSDVNSGNVIAARVIMAGLAGAAFLVRLPFTALALLRLLSPHH
jgi:hypothetical protein